jgi:hypothetical protein
MSFNLRMLIKGFAYVKYCEDKAKQQPNKKKYYTELLTDLMDDMMGRDEELAYIHDLLQNGSAHTSMGEMAAKFMQRFDQSRRTFYRKKKQLLKLMGEEEEEQK